MSKWVSIVMSSAMLILLLAACGGGDDADPTATSAATATTAAPVLGTATGSADAVATPTVAAAAPSATPTTLATAPPRPIVKATPTAAAATPTTNSGSTSALEDRMLSTLLQVEDFSSDWVQDSFGIREPSTDDDPGICNTPPFPDRDLRIAGVEARYSLNVGTPAFVLQNIVLFPAATALDAMEYARQASTCTEWTDDAGLVYTMLPVSGPSGGDETLTFGMSFDSNGTPLYTEYSFVRVGGAILTIAFITVDGADVTTLRDLVTTAIQRFEIAGIGPSTGTGNLADALLVADDIALIDSVNVWGAMSDTDPSDPDRFAFCGAVSFPDVFGALNEVGRGIDGNNGDGPFAMHTIVELADGDGPAAMEMIRSDMSCETWSDEDGDYAVQEVGDLDVGDDTFWMLFVILGPDGSPVVQAGFGFTQIGDYISVVGLAHPGEIDLELFGGLIALGAEKVIAVAP